MFVMMVMRMLSDGGIHSSDDADSNDCGDGGSDKPIVAIALAVMEMMGGGYDDDGNGLDSGFLQKLIISHHKRFDDKKTKQFILSLLLCVQYN